MVDSFWSSLHSCRECRLCCARRGGAPFVRAVCTIIPGPVRRSAGLACSLQEAAQQLLLHTFFSHDVVGAHPDLRCRRRGFTAKRADLVLVVTTTDLVQAVRTEDAAS